MLCNDDVELQLKIGSVRSMHSVVDYLLLSWQTRLDRGLSTTERQSSRLAAFIIIIIIIIYSFIKMQYIK